MSHEATRLVAPDAAPSRWPYFPSVGERVHYHGHHSDHLGTIVEVDWYDGDVRIRLDDDDEGYAHDVKCGMGPVTYAPLNPEYQVWWTWGRNYRCGHSVTSFMDKCWACGSCIELPLGIR